MVAVPAGGLAAGSWQLAGGGQGSTVHNQVPFFFVFHDYQYFPLTRILSFSSPKRPLLAPMLLRVVLVAQVDAKTVAHYTKPCRWERASPGWLAAWLLAMDKGTKEEGKRHLHHGMDA